MLDISEQEKTRKDKRVKKKGKKLLLGFLLLFVTCCLLFSLYSVRLAVCHITVKMFSDNMFCIGINEPLEPWHDNGVVESQADLREKDGYFRIK